MAALAVAVATAAAVAVAAVAVNDLMLMDNSLIWPLLLSLSQKYYSNFFYSKFLLLGT